MPLYVAARKCGLPQYLAMMVAHTPGTLFHANINLVTNPKLAAIIVISSYAVFPAILWMAHRSKPNGTSSPTPNHKTL